MGTVIGIDIIATLLVVVAIIYIGTRPERFRIERSAQVNAPTQVVFGLINDLRQWPRWSPYEKLDPNMRRTFEGPPAGPGAASSWEGNSKAGAGRMTITESKPGELVSLRLEFLRPFKAVNQANFALTPAPGGTRVSWIMEGKNNLMGKIMSPFMDGMLGKEFAQGLINLNTPGGNAESQAGCAAPMTRSCRESYKGVDRE